MIFKISSEEQTNKQTQNIVIWAEKVIKANFPSGTHKERQTSKWICELKEPLRFFQMMDKQIYYYHHYYHY